MRSLLILMRLFLIACREFFVRIVSRVLNNAVPIVPLRWTVTLVVLGVMLVTGCSDSATDSQPPFAAKRPIRPTGQASVEQRLSVAEKKLQANQFDQASDLLQAVLVEQPEHPYARFLFAQSNHRQGKTNVALSILEEGAQESPDHADRFINESARIRLSDGDIMGALEQYDRVLAIRPDDTQTRRLVATLLNQLGLRFDANEHLRVLCKTVPLELHELHCLVQPTADIGRTKATQWVSQSPLSLVESLRAIETNRIDDSVRSLQESQLVQQQNAAAMCLLGRALSMQGDQDSFRNWYSKRKHAWQRYPDFWIAIGNHFASDGEHYQAMQAYGAAVNREPMCRSAMMRLGQSLAGLQRTEDARQIMSRAQEIGNLTELVMDVAATPQSSADAYKILSNELTRMGLPYEGFAWKFLGTALFNPRGASIETHAAGIAAIRETVHEDSLCLLTTCGISTNSPTLADLDIEFWDDKINEISSNPRPPPADTQNLSQFKATPVFRNVADTVGLQFRYVNADPVVQKYFLLHQSLGAGLACLDMELDGHVDIYAVQGGFNATPNQVPSDEVSTARSNASNSLFRNCDGRFIDICVQANADDAGYAMGITAGDWNQDGFQDIVIGNLSVNTLLLNQGDGTFDKMPMRSDWNEGLFTTGLAIADIDGDALPDLVEVNYVDDARIFESIQFEANGKPRRLPGPTQFMAATDRVFLSVGEGSMQRLILSESQDESQPRAAMGLVVGNLDATAGNEIFVANDQTANHLWKAKRHSVDVDFIDVAPIQGVGLGVRGLPLASMGVAVADFDGNGLPDLHVTSFNDELSNHFMQLQSGSFDDRIVSSGIADHSRQYVGFGTQTLDFDNDAAADLWVGNGHLEDFRDTGQEFYMPIQLLVADQNRFSLASLNDDEPFFAKKHLSRALARLDWNGDGSTDILVGDLLAPLALLENQTTNPNHWLTIQLVGTRCERDAIGAKIECQLGESTRYHFVCTGDGYMCRNENAVFMGLGLHSSVDRLTIHWPDGTEQKLANLPVDRRIIVIQGIQDAFEVLR